MFFSLSKFFRGKSDVKTQSTLGWDGILQKLEQKEPEVQAMIAEMQTVREQEKQIGSDVYIIMETEILRLVLRHIKTLVTKYEQATYCDDYGVIKLNDAIKEIDYFINNVVRKNLPAANLPPHIPRQVYQQVLSNVLDDPAIIDETIREHVEPFLAIDTENDFADAIKKAANSYVLYLHTILAPTSYRNDNKTLHFLLGDNCQSICDLVRAGIEDNQTITIGPILSRVIDLQDLSNLQKWFCERHEHKEALADIVTGQEFELFCQKRLQELGLDVRTTKATGDFGADLIVEQAGSKTIIQCKFYSKPIGLKAVQEAFTAMEFNNADKAAVVSNQSYTKAARQLANKTNVLLLHVNELDQLS